eukprot:TRINITY_DN34482_c0_g1_i1.p2 TRINITY_DN34482_c0_g1~~TRINITY_DN34482_c0_g1_i1.p2  ORF type:complete len:105 (+),score=12.78 TRINITY_DN34482_c0_g1_i1:8-322(+)
MIREISISLLPERASLLQPRFTTGGLAQNCLTVSTYHNSLRMAEHSGYVEASLTLNIHEEGVGRLHETLELMLSLLKLRWRMKEIDVVLEHHDCLWKGGESEFG